MTGPAAPRERTGSTASAQRVEGGSRAGAWSPLRHGLFRAFWIAVLASQIGTWMQNAGAAWLMTTLSASPVLVALMQTATSLPTAVLGLPAGALADTVDRRRLLIATQTWMLLAAAALAGLTFAGETTPAILLGLTLAIGIGVALTGPAWQATSPHLVPPEELSRAVAMNGVAVNVGRAAGPAFGGLLLAAAGAASVFLANAVSFMGLLGVVTVRWRPAPAERTLPPERLVGAIRAGLRFVRHSPPLRAVLVRAGLFVLGASALFALLPVIARNRLGLGSGGFGLLLGLLGVGAIAGAWLLPSLRRRLPAERLVLAGTLALAASIAAVAATGLLEVAFPAMLVAGLAWITLMTSFNVAAQTGAPAWVRARALSAYLIVFQGGLALGSASWGAVASAAGSRDALFGAAGFLVAGLAAAPRFPLRVQRESDLRTVTWSDPLVEAEPAHEDGPVLVSIEYRIAAEDERAFLALMAEVRRVRRRDGAYRWSLYRDLADPGRLVESFLVQSWLEHLRQHERGTAADRALRDRVRALHRGDGPPHVSHLLAVRTATLDREPGAPSAGAGP